ncbi:chloroplastic lipocalin [Selaginella moellendorffii]|nr:chloroplastic lipocalin [Selaginella moellendorffii]|eukprot:XP_002972706.2 chloroplastic lipocalin [Selaginella moellendorffii]
MACSASRAIHPVAWARPEVPSPSPSRHSQGDHVKLPSAANVAQRAAVAAAVLVLCTNTSEAMEQTANVDHSLVSTISSSEEEKPPPFMMAGMTAKNFDPARYAGRWFEVASLKRGFAGQGQEDCHCTQGVYRFDEANRALQVDTFCVHGSPDGYVTGIRGKVQCTADTSLKREVAALQIEGGVSERCYLRFPTLPFIPREPYDVISTDYDSYALVSGAKDTSFVQIYSRTPNPGREFIDKYKAFLGELGYDDAAIKDTPQDCQEMSMGDLSAMMAAPGMEEMMSNTFYPPPLGLTKAVEFNPFTSIFDTLKKLVKLYFS